jgi:hypothetical protein
MSIVKNYDFWCDIKLAYSNFNELLSLLSNLYLLSNKDKDIIRKRKYFLNIVFNKILDKIPTIEKIKNTNTCVNDLPLFDCGIASYLLQVNDSLYIYMRDFIARIHILTLDKDTHIDCIISLVKESKVAIGELLSKHDTVKDCVSTLIDKIDNEGMILYSVSDDVDEFSQNKVISYLFVISNIYELSADGRDMTYEMTLEKSAASHMKVVRVGSGENECLDRAFSVLSLIMKNPTVNSLLFSFINLIDHSITNDLNNENHFRIDDDHNTNYLINRISNIIPMLSFLTSTQPKNTNYVFGFIDSCKVMFLNTCKLNQNSNSLVKSAQLLLVILHEFMHLHSCNNGARKFHYKHFSPITKIHNKREMGKTLRSLYA